ncbi:MAG TPA: FAD-dependent oxidoreductase [Stenomitos sp.]
MNNDMIWDVAIAGAGIVGLACAQALQQRGYQVIVLDKSRGVGGRVATRRLYQTCVDHGIPTLQCGPQDAASYREWVANLVSQGVLQPWPLTARHRVTQRLSSLEYPINSEFNDEINDADENTNGTSQHYYAPAGITAIAKSLATNLPLQLGQRVVAIHLHRNPAIWQVQTEPTTETETALTVQAKALILAMPAPQALELCLPLQASGLSTSVLNALAQVTFAPCLTAIASYNPTIPWQSLPWAELSCCADPTVMQILADCSKREMPCGPQFVFHSTSTFATQHLESTDLAAVGQLMVSSAQRHVPWLANPEHLQVHRWRYAIATGGHPGHALNGALDLPLWICGDWCTGSRLQDAFAVGQAVAKQMA